MDEWRSDSIEGSGSPSTTRMSANKRPQICDQALEKYPDLRVIAIDPNRNSIVYYWLSLEVRSSRIETSEGGVLSALRGKVDLAGR
jgi:hypothetical protein